MKAVVVLLSLLAMAAPASAATPPPSYLRFDGADPAGLMDATGDPVCGVVLNTRPPGQNHFLQTLCQPVLHLAFAKPQASVELFAKVIPAMAGTSPRLVATAHTGGADVTGAIDDASTFQPIVLAAPGGAATITSVDLSAPGNDIGIDDVALSDVPQPDTTIASAPDPSTPATVASFALASNVPATFRCSVDAGPFGACDPFSGLAIGRHGFEGAAVDAYGAVDPTPVIYAWTVVPPAPDTVAQRVGASAVFSSPQGATHFQCSVDGGAFADCVSPFAPGGSGAHRVAVRALGPNGQADPTPAVVDLPADADHDNIPDDLETLPLAVRPAEVGTQAVATLDSGTARVRLPGASDYVPFAGIARLPVGSIVDATKASVTVAVASNGFSKGDRRYREASVTLSAGIFQIRQARMRKGVTRVVQIPVEFVLASPPGAGIQCRRGVSKGVVRKLVAKGKGVFRVTGGASHADARNSTFTTTDRCDGTLTRVSKGHVRVSRKTGGRAIVVHQGRRYFAKARLFIAKKGRTRA